jgi:hypothetical protein
MNCFMVETKLFQRGKGEDNINYRCYIRKKISYIIHIYKLL